MSIGGDVFRKERPPKPRMPTAEEQEELKRRIMAAKAEELKRAQMAKAVDLKKRE